MCRPVIRIYNTLWCVSHREHVKWCHFAHANFEPAAIKMFNEFLHFQSRWQTSGPDGLCPWNRQVVFTEEAALWMLDIMHIAQLSTTDIHRKNLWELLLNVKEAREYISGPWWFCQAVCTQLQFSFVGKTFHYWLEPKWDSSIYCKLIYIWVLCFCIFTWIKNLQTRHKCQTHSHKGCISIMVTVRLYKCRKLVKHVKYLSSNFNCSIALS